MERQVTIFGEDGAITGVTFARRAKQLVNKRRALWLDGTHTAIRLTPEEPERKLKPEPQRGSGEKKHIEKEFIEKEEDSEMDETVVMPQTNGEREHIRASEPRHTGAVDDSLLLLARKRVKAKKKLIRDMLIYAVFIPFFFVFAFSIGDDEGWFFAVGVMTTWGVFVLRDILAYFSPYISALNPFRREHVDPVEAEYKKLSSMPPSRLASEYEKL